MIHYPRAAACSYTEERRSSRRARVQEELNMIHYPGTAASLFTRLRAEESKVGGNMMNLPTTTKWEQKAPSWSSTLGLRHVYIPKSEEVQDELEFKKNSTWSTTLGLRHVYLPICGWKSQVTSSRHIVVCLLAKSLMKLLYICTCVLFLVYDILEFKYFMRENYVTSWIAWISNQIFLGCPIVLSCLNSLEKPYYCTWGRARTPTWDCSLVKKNGHVRDMT